MTWRVGAHYGIHVYDGDVPIATFHTAADAAAAVAAHNLLAAVDPELAQQGFAERYRDLRTYAESLCVNTSAPLPPSLGVVIRSKIGVDILRLMGALPRS